MRLTRRESLALGAATAAGSLLSGCNPAANRAEDILRQPAIPPRASDDLAVATLNRFGFGPNNQDLAAIRKAGVDTWFEDQLAPGSEEPGLLEFRLARLDIQHLSPWELRDWPMENIIRQLQQATVLRAVYSPWQVRERIVDFWSNHFNIYCRKGLAAYRKPWDDRHVIRRHALGAFPDMVMASAKSTAMLVYLDQQNSHARRPNENYARELLELHTLGVDAGYTQRDVMEVARCFTGWSEERGFLKRRGEFLFRPELHDQGDKIVLGERISSGGVSEGEQVVRLITHRPETAKHIASKLVEYYLGKPRPKLEASLTETYLESGGDIPSLMRLIFADFKNDPGTVVKRPLDFVVSALRATESATDGGSQVLDAMDRMGQPLNLWPMPDGYSMETAAWSSSLLARWNFALQMSRDRIRGTTIDLDKLIKQTDVVSAVFREEPEGSWLDHVRQQIDGQPPALALALALSSPEFQWR